MRYLSLIIIVLFLGSCKLTREQRKANRKSKKIEKIAKEYGLFKTDTATAIVQYVTDSIQIDTVIQLETDTLYLDTLSIVRIFPPRNFSYEKDGVKVRLKRIDNFEVFRYDLSVTVVPDTFIREVRVPFETIQPKEYIKVPIKMSKWQSFMLKLGNGVFWLLIAALVFLVVRFVIKFYIGR